MKQVLGMLLISPLICSVLFSLGLILWNNPTLCVITAVAGMFCAGMGLLEK